MGGDLVCPSDRMGLEPVPSRDDAQVIRPTDSVQVRPGSRHRPTTEGETMILVLRPIAVEG